MILCNIYNHLLLHGKLCRFYMKIAYVLVVCRCVGQACSMGSLLLAAGAPGMRYSLPNSRIMVHQPSGGAQVNYLFC